MNAHTRPSRDIYQDVTDRIIAALEIGSAPWLRPWRDNASGSAMEPYNAATGRPYNGINLLILGIAPYADLGWITYKQAQELGGHVRKGERGVQIIFWKFDEREDATTGKSRVVPFARGYTVFNISQCDGIDETKLKRPVPPTAGQTDMNALAARVGATVRHGGNRAYYVPSADFIAMPSLDAFKDETHYQSTLAHELTHWTGHKSRNNRDFSGRFGSEAYAFEELIAEIGSAFLCARHNIPLEGLQHADYLASWLRVLKADKRAIFTASSQAKQAAAFLMREDEDHAEDETTAEAA